MNAKHLFVSILLCASLVASPTMPWLKNARGPSGGGGGGGGSPTYDSQIQTKTASPDGYHSGATDTITLPANVSAGKRLVVMFQYGDGVGSMELSSITDTQGNTYTVHGNKGAVINEDKMAIASAHITTALTTSDSITATFSSPGYCARYSSMFVLSNCAASGQPDIVFNGEDTDGTPSTLSATTTETNTVAIGIARVYSSTFSGTAWDTITTTSSQIWYKKEFTSAGAKDPALTHGGTYSGGIWVAFK